MKTVRMFAQIIPSLCLQRQKAVLQAHVDQANQGGPTSLLSKVMYARKKRTFDKKLVRFYFSVRPSVEGVLDISMVARRNTARLTVWRGGNKIKL